MGFQPPFSSSGKIAGKVIGTAALTALSALLMGGHAAEASFFQSAGGGSAANTSGAMLPGSSIPGNSFFGTSGGAAAGGQYSTAQGTLFVSANNAFGADQATIHRLAQSGEIYAYLNSLPQANQQAILQMNILNQDGSINLSAIDQLFASGSLAGGNSQNQGGQQFVQANNVFGADKNSVLALIDSGQIYAYLNSLPQANQQAILQMNILNQDGSVNRNRVAQIFDSGAVNGNANGNVNNVPLNFPYSGGPFYTGNGYNPNNGSYFNTGSNNQYQFDPFTNNGGQFAANAGLRVACRANPMQAPAGSSIVWTAYVQGGNGQYGFTWSGSDGLEGTAQTVSKAYSAAGLKSARVTVTSGNALITADCQTFIGDQNQGSWCDANAQQAYAGRRSWKWW